MFVEVLTAAQAEGEPAIGQYLHRRCLLRDDGGVISHRRARHIGVEVHPLGGLCHRAEHGPGVGGVPLRSQPRREVVTADREVETALFG